MNKVNEFFPGSINSGTIVVFCVLYYILSVWTYGINVSSGLFIPNLVIGAAWGRLIGVYLQYLFPEAVSFVNLKSRIL